MRKYDSRLEKNIRVERLVREWTRSGLLEKSQHDGILRSLEIPVRQTNIFLRLILFGFTLLIIVASVFLTGKILGIEGRDAIGFLCGLAAVCCLFIAEGLVSSFRFYRFGIEEAAAVASVGLAVVGAASVASASNEAVVAAVVGALCGFGIYYRFGYIYAAVASMLCVAAIPFQFRLPESAERLIASASLAVLWAAAHWLHRKYGDEYPGDELRTIAAVDWCAIYVFLNLHLSFDRVLYSGTAVHTASSFYWFTYAMTWVLPAIGIALGLRNKDRLMLDVNVGAALMTLITNKSYLYGVRQPWDPIIFGVLLIGVAIAVRRWLDRAVDGLRRGFTSKRLLSSDKRRVGVVAAASFVFRPDVPSGPSTPAEQRLDPGGGRSGGAGASGSF